MMKKSVARADAAKQWPVEARTEIARLNDLLARQKVSYEREIEFGAARSSEVFQPLTDKQIEVIRRQLLEGDGLGFRTTIRAVEKFHSDRNETSVAAEPVPSGWTLMPAVPTPEIVDVLINKHDVYGSAGEMYAALIAAAQVGAARREK